LTSRIGTKTTFSFDPCLREADDNLAWARIDISGDKQTGYAGRKSRPVRDFLDPAPDSDE
jgi:hypothetical protein